MNIYINFSIRGGIITEIDCRAVLQSCSQGGLAVLGSCGRIDKDEDFSCLAVVQSEGRAVGESSLRVKRSNLMIITTTKQITTSLVPRSS